MTLRVVEGAPRPFVCTWCAGRYRSRADLSRHWRDVPECKKNRNVSNPLQSKYGQADMVVTVPGEATLHAVRSRDCTHEETKPLRDADGRLLGRQCMNCYGAMLEDPT